MVIATSIVNREIQELETALMELRSAVDIESYLMMTAPAMEDASSSIVDCVDFEFPSQPDIDDSEDIGSSVRIHNVIKYWGCINFNDFFFASRRRAIR